MLDINFLRNNPDIVKTALKNRQKDTSLVDDVIASDQQYLSTLRQYESLKADQNKIVGKPTGEELQRAIDIKKKLKKIEEDLKSFEANRLQLLEEIPNIPAPDVPLGQNESDNLVIKTVGQKPDFDFQPLDHQSLGEKLGIIDKEHAAKVSGSRFGYYQRQAATLQMAIMFYTFKKLTDLGFIGMIPPLMVKTKSEWGCGYTSNKNLLGAYYSIPEDDLVFISSSEHSVVPYHSDEILDSSLLPLKYVNYSSCFRRESGTYGKDMRGMLRLHHFHKVEMNIFCLPDPQISDALQLEMLQIQEDILQDFGLHYQVVNCCTGDLPQPNRRMYDVNVWFPGLGEYKEVGSCSNCTDYQARRLNTRVKINGQNEFVHILNATAVSDRPLNAIIENFQTKDGYILIPPCLQPLCGFEVIKPASK